MLKINYRKIKFINFLKIKNKIHQINLLDKIWKKIKKLGIKTSKAKIKGQIEVGVKV